MTFQCVLIAKHNVVVGVPAILPMLTNQANTFTAPSALTGPTPSITERGWGG